MTWLEIISEGLKAYNTTLSILDRAVIAYQADVKLKWAQSLQAGLQPLQQGLPTTDEEKLAAAKAVADAIANMK